MQRVSVYGNHTWNIHGTRHYYFGSFITSHAFFHSNVRQIGHFNFYAITDPHNGAYVRRNQGRRDSHIG